MLETTRAYAVCALLVFLHLLEGELQRIAKLFLARVHHLSAHANPAADVHVDLIRLFFPRHKSLSVG